MKVMSSFTTGAWRTTICRGGAMIRWRSGEDVFTCGTYYRCRYNKLSRSLSNDRRTYATSSTDLPVVMKQDKNKRRPIKRLRKKLVRCTTADGSGDIVSKFITTTTKRTRKNLKAIDDIVDNRASKNLAELSPFFKALGEQIETRIEHAQNNLRELVFGNAEGQGGSEGSSEAGRTSETRIERHRRRSMKMDARWWRWNLLFALVPSAILALICESFRSEKEEYYRQIKIQEEKRLALARGGMLGDYDDDDTFYNSDDDENVKHLRTSEEKVQAHLERPAANAQTPVINPAKDVTRDDKGPDRSSTDKGGGDDLGDDTATVLLRRIERLEEQLALEKERNRKALLRQQKRRQLQEEFANETMSPMTQRRLESKVLEDYENPTKTTDEEPSRSYEEILLVKLEDGVNFLKDKVLEFYHTYNDVVNTKTDKQKNGMAPDIKIESDETDQIDSSNIGVGKIDHASVDESCSDDSTAGRTTLAKDIGQEEPLISPSTISSNETSGSGLETSGHRHESTVPPDNNSNENNNSNEKSGVWKSARRMVAGLISRVRRKNEESTKDDAIQQRHSTDGDDGESSK